MEEIISEVIQTLADEGLQSDTRFAESFVYSRVEKGSGPIRIRAELLTRGISDYVIEMVISEYADQWKTIIERVYEKRFKGEQLGDSFEERAKRASFLQSRGFTYDQISSVMDQKND